jgi:cytochrome c-type biogenesis protein CcmH/NrfG
MAELERAVTLAPDDARFAYVYAVALHDSGSPRKARETLSAALSRHPFDRESLMALASYEMEEGDVAAAAEVAERLALLDPDDREAQGFVAAIRAMARTPRR